MSTGLIKFKRLKLWAKNILFSFSNSLIVDVIPDLQLASKVNKNPLDFLGKKTKFHVSGTDD